MIISKVQFIGSFSDLAQCPVHSLSEVALIGRSNVGKSSLINMLVKQKNLARTSATPGKTLLLNFFLLNQNFFLVDLPGYGFASISKTEKERIRKLIYNYLLHRDTLKCVLLLIDIRHPRQPADKEFMEWCANHGIPFCIVFTKADKLTAPQIKKNIGGYQEEMKQDWEYLPEMFVTSSTSGKGREELLTFMGTL